jgi:hypothetical protein
MAKKSMLERETKRKKLVTKYSEKRKEILIAILLIILLNGVLIWMN